MISQYNVAGMPAGPRNIMLAVGKSIRLEGFIVSNHFNLFPEFQKDMSGWIREGKLRWKETVEHGIENAPTAFLKLFTGEALLQWHHGVRHVSYRAASLHLKSVGDIRGDGGQEPQTQCAQSFQRRLRN
jgi:hypothetical protein